MGTRIAAQSALLLAAALCIQSLRFLLPMPPTISMFLIGTGINLILLLACRISLRSAVIISAALPITAFFQGQLPIFVFCPAAAIANIIFACAAYKWNEDRRIWLAPILKAGALYLMSWGIVEIAQLPRPMTHTILFMMGFAQLITATLAIFLEKKIKNRIFSVKNH
ncbi:MAG: hypothetical protein J6B02_03820 [Selenomonadales bacterium]|nr:hypothetical protein [Selenomonadales bacterium]